MKKLLLVFICGLSFPFTFGQNIIGEKVLNLLNEGAVVINYDRGELIDTHALDRALSSGKVRYVAIDADIFKDPNNGEISGPMAPYIELSLIHI